METSVGFLFWLMELNRKLRSSHFLFFRARALLRFTEKNSNIEKLV